VACSLALCRPPVSFGSLFGSWAGLGFVFQSFNARFAAEPLVVSQLYPMDTKRGGKREKR